LDDWIKSTGVEGVASAYPGNRLEESLDQVKLAEAF
jgi:hypothetical protein